jgi:hypothetical protein
MEPDWSKSIESSTVCFWFYILAIFNAVAGVAGILATTYLVSMGIYKSSSLIGIIIAVMLACTNTWFLFLVCNRGLKT